VETSSVGWGCAKMTVTWKLARSRPAMTPSMSSPTECRNQKALRKPTRIRREESGAGGRERKGAVYCSDGHDRRYTWED
jgi:hypothetical protein